MSQGIAAPDAKLPGRPFRSSRRAKAWLGVRRKLVALSIASLVLVLAGAAIWQAQLDDGVIYLPTIQAAMAAAPVDSGAIAEQPPAASPAANAQQLDSLQPVSAKGGELLASSASTLSAADARLLRIFGLIATSQAAEALDEAAKLARDMPNFGLAHLVYADLLKTQARPAEGFGAVDQPLRAEAAERLRELVSEARARVVAAGHRPPPAAVPAQFVRIDRSVRHAIAVDVSKSRLYLFQNTDRGLVLKKDYYSSVGKLGFAKQVEGDLRTPLGVYFGTGRIAESRLRDPAVEDRYGAAAIALNYPNHYDQLKGRTGSGIWLHGVATSLFSRAPLATDGCVAVANPDMLELTQVVERQETPILIAEKIEWVDAGVAQKRREQFMNTFEAWKTARVSSGVDELQQFYAVDDDAGKSDRRRPATLGRPTSIDGVSVLWWQDDREVVVVSYSESLPGQRRAKQKRQYWLQNDGRWKVIFEGNVA